MKPESIGYFSKPHGLKGHLILFTTLDFDENLKVIFVEHNGSHAPYFIEEMTAFNKGFLIKLEGINDINAAGLLKNKEVLADHQYIIKQEEFEYTGFTLIDQTKGAIGTIEGLEGSEENPLLKITVHAKELLLPYTEELVTKVVKSKKQVFYNAPDGLIDLFLNE